jgi:hypothetical protein
MRFQNYNFMRAIVIAILSMLFVPEFAASTDDLPYTGHMYPGTACKYYGPQASDTFLNPSGYKANGVKNTSTVAKYVVCPLALDSPDIDYGSDMMAPMIFIRSASATCGLYWINPLEDGDTGEYDIKPMDDIVDQGEGIYVYTTPGETMMEGFPRSAAIYCSIPANAVINAYAWSGQHQ